MADVSYVFPDVTAAIELLACSSYYTSPCTSNKFKTSHFSENNNDGDLRYGMTPIVIDFFTKRYIQCLCCDNDLRVSPGKRKASPYRPS